MPHGKAGHGNTVKLGVHMIRIGICDEAERDLQMHKRLLQGMMGKECINAEILCFQSGEALLLEIEQNKSMDIILIEVGLQGINGVETARKIRETDTRTILIFITRYEQYWKEIINVQPFAYIDKPAAKERLEEAVMRAIAFISGRGGRIQFFSRKKEYRIFLREIFYFESDKREILVFCEEKNYSFYRKLDEVEEELKQYSEKFLRIHKSFLVNPIYIKESSYEKIIMCDGKEITISPKYRKIIRQYYDDRRD